MPSLILQGLFNKYHQIFKILFEIMIYPELGTFESWISRLMLSSLSFLNLQINSIFIPFPLRFQIKQPIRSNGILRSTNERTGISNIKRSGRFLVKFKSAQSEYQNQAIGISSIQQKVFQLWSDETKQKCPKGTIKCYLFFNK